MNPIITIIIISSRRRNFLPLPIDLIQWAERPEGFDECGAGIGECKLGAGVEGVPFCEEVGWVWEGLGVSWFGKWKWKGKGKEKGKKRGTDGILDWNGGCGGRFWRRGRAMVRGQ